jgi:hypothetical protein
MVAGPGGEIGLFPARGKAAARSSGSPTARREAGIRTLSFAPAATRTRDLLLRSSRSWPALTWMRPGQGPFRAPLGDCR